MGGILPGVPWTNLAFSTADDAVGPSIETRGEGTEYSFFNAEKYPDAWVGIHNYLFVRLFKITLVINVFRVL